MDRIDPASEPAERARIFRAARAPFLATQAVRAACVLTLSTLTAGLNPAGAQSAFVVDATSADADTNVGDGTCATAAGECTLLAALQEANAAADLTTITFDIPESDAGYDGARGVWTIEPSSSLIATQPVAIDGSTQSGYDGLPVVEISGASSPGNGLDIRAPGSSVNALGVVSWSGAAIVVAADSVTVTGSLLGTDRTNATDLGNAWGVNAGASTGSRIGGDSEAERNVISGNATGIAASGWTDSRIAGNRIGTTIDGTTALGNSTDGISFTAADGLSIEDNLISGNGWNGISGSTAGGAPVTISGNFIGTDAAGAAALANGRSGVSISGSGGVVTIGGSTPGDRNVISGNTEHGIRIFNSGLAAVVGNYIGSDGTGLSAVPNGLDGINVSSSGNTIGGTGPLDGNVVSGNAGAGIRQAGGAANEYYGNTIGMTSLSDAALGNGDWGVVIGASSSATVFGSAQPAGRNLVSGNASGGLQINGNDHVVTGNYVGTDGSGEAALPNGGPGIHVAGGQRAEIGGGDSGEGNLVSGNDGHGLYIAGAQATVSGNVVGLSADGLTALANAMDGIRVEGDANTIGGDADGDANLVSGNTGSGISLSYPLTTNFAENNVVRGNHVGFDATLTSTIGNGAAGILVSFQAPDNTIDGNHVGGNAEWGIRVESTARRAIVTRNIVGLAPDMTTPAANEQGGIITNTDDGTFGGVGDEGNTIAHNAGPGIAVVTGTIGGFASGFGNDIRGNAIYDNDGIGIDLGASPDGVTLNDALDADANFGGNRQQNHPVITSASRVPADVEGYLNSAPNETYTLDFYANAVCDATGWGEGRQYIGSTEVTTDGAGNATFDVTLGSLDLVGDYVTATATRLVDGTSEFGPCVQVDAVDLVISKSVSADPVLVDSLLAYSIAVWNTGPGGATDVAVTDTLPAGFAAGSITAGSDDCSIAGEVLNCHFAALAPGDTARVVFDGYFIDPGVATNVATASAAQDEVNVNNNAAAVVVQILETVSDVAIFSFSQEELVGELPDTLTIAGQGFEPGATVSLEPTDQIGDDNPGSLDAEVLSVTAGEIVVAVDIPDEQWVGAFDVVVANPSGATTRRPIVILPYLAYPVVRGTGALAFPIGFAKSNYLQIVNIGPDAGIVWVEIYPPDPDAIELQIFASDGSLLWDGLTADDPTVATLMLDLDADEVVNLRTSWRVDPEKVIFPETGIASGAGGGPLEASAGVADVGFNSGQTVSWEATRGHARGQMTNMVKAVLLGGVCRSIGQKFAGLDVSVLDAAIDAGMDVLKQRGEMRPEDVLQEVGEALGEHLIPGYGQVQFAAEIGACIGEILNGISDAIKRKAKSSADRLRRRHGSTKRAKDALLDKVLEGGASARFRLQAALEIERQMDEAPCNPHPADRNKYKGWVRGPWDPNDKVTNADFACEYGVVDEELRCVRYFVPLAAAETPITYTLLFENKADATGSATIVTVTDELPPELDPTTLEVTGSSHPGVLSYDVAGQTATFTFDNIDLPPNVNPPEGEGYVEFVVNPRIGLFSGDEIRNDASIVFDFNPPIETPEVVHEIRALADLQLTAVVDADSLLTDSVATVVYTLTNAGPDVAHDIEFAVSGGMDTFVSGLTSAVGACSVVPTRGDCVVDELAVGAAVAFEATAFRTSIGFIELDGSVAQAETDGDPGDNVVQSRVNVYGSVGMERSGADVPVVSALLPLYPNPAGGEVHVEFHASERTRVDIEVYDVVGRRVSRILGDDVAAGRYTMTYDAGRLAAGVYFVRAQIGAYSGVRKVVVVR